MKKPTQTVDPANSASCTTATGVTTGNSLPVVQPHPDFVKTVKFLWVGIGLFATSILVICLIGTRNHGVPSWLLGVFTLELLVFVLFLVMLSARHPCRQKSCAQNVANRFVRSLMKSAIGGFGRASNAM